VICTSVNFDPWSFPVQWPESHFFAKLQFSSKDRSRNMEAGQPLRSRHAPTVEPPQGLQTNSPAPSVPICTHLPSVYGFARPLRMWQSTTLVGGLTVFVWDVTMNNGIWFRLAAVMLVNGLRQVGLV
jgi:hypothetical protein